MSLAIEKVKLRNEFYRDSFRRVVFILFISGIINIIMALSIIYLVYTKPKPSYFATFDNGTIVELHALSSPVTTDNAVINWVSSAIPSLNSLDFINYRRQIEQNRHFFTDYGWKEYIKAFQTQIDKIKNNQYVVSGALSGVPVIVQKGVLNGKYSWKIQVPVIINYQKGSKVETNNVYWSILVQRNNEFNNEIFGISQIIQHSDIKDKK